MLYPLSYEGVPIQYKAPRTTVRHGTLEATRSRAVPMFPPAHCPSCVPARVHRMRTPAPGTGTAPTMYE